MNEINLSPMAIQILEKRYLKKDGDKIIETPEQLFERVVNYVCSDNKKLRDGSLELMRELKFLPNSPTLMNAGITNMLSACFTVHIDDSLESIVHNALWEQAYIHKMGGGVGINFCYSEDTEVFTNNGWKYFKDITKEDEVLTRLFNGNSKFVSILDIICNDYDGELIRTFNNQIDLLVTPEHNFYVLKRLKNKKFNDYKEGYKVLNASYFLNMGKGGNWYDIPCEFKWEGKEERYFYLPSCKYYTWVGNFYLEVNKNERKILMDDWLEFLGYFISEGSTYVKNRFNGLLSNCQILIGQSNTNGFNKEKIRECLNRLNISYTINDNGFYFTDTQLASYLLQFGKAKDKFIPSGIKKLSKRQLNILLSALVLGDGHIDNNDRRFFSISNRLASDVQELFFKVGSRARIVEKENNGGKSFIFWVEEKIQGEHILVSQVKSKLEKYKGKVYDVRIDEPHTLFVRRNGKCCWSGNSNLRPKGDTIKTTNGKTTGVLAFIKNFDLMSASIHQGGKRDGANMTILSIYHPEIEEFIKAKTENHKDYENMNFSVLVDDKFMKSVMEDMEINLSFPIKSDNVRKKVKAKYLFDLICESAWKCGCPGMLFEDSINRGNPLKEHLWITNTNPCAEQPLFCGKYNGNVIAESCNLGSINLSKLVNEKRIDWLELERIIDIATRFLDSVIDKNIYPFSYIEKGTKMTRKIGLGVTGFSDMLILMDISYNSLEAIELAKEIMKRISEISHKTSEKLAIEYGTYPLANLINDKKRNCLTTTIAPTGSIGRIMLGHGYALGIEPPFAISMESNIIESKIKDGIHPLLIKKFEELGYNESTIKTLINDIKRDGSSVQRLKIPENIKKLFLTANEIPIEQHIAVQAAFQEFTDNAVSKTINMNNRVTVRDVKDAFFMSYNSGCKGITIYRDNSKEKQVMNTSKIEDIPIPRPRFKDHIGIIREIKTGCGSYYCGVTFDKYGIFETFPIPSGEGGCPASQETLGRSSSTHLRFNNPIEILIKQLHKPKCDVCLTKNDFYNEKGKFIGIRSCSDGLSNQLNDYYTHSDLILELINLQNKIHNLFNIDSKEDNLSTDFKNINSKNTLINDIKYCKNCGTILIHQEGCHSLQCPNCGVGGC